MTDNALERTPTGDVMQEAALVRLERFTAVKLFEPGAIDPVLEQIEAEARSEAAKLDISTEASRKALASLSYKVARSKTFIDTQRKELVTGEKRRLAKIDEEGRRIWNRLESLQDEVRKPLTEWEEADKARIAAHEAVIAETTGAGAYTLQNWQTLPIEAMKDRLTEIETPRDWQEFQARGTLAVKTAAGQIREAIDRREKYDAEQAELARHRAEAAERERVEREERIAREATEKAEREAKERAERTARDAEAERFRLEAEAKAAEARAKAAEEKAKRDAVEAEERREREVRAAAERAEREKTIAIEAERQRVAAEEKRQKDEQEKRERNKKHLAKINNEAKDDLMTLGLSAEQATAVVTAIATGTIRNVTINY